MLPDLSSILKYTNQRIINCYNKDYPNNSLKAEEALQELLKYLWLNQKLVQDQSYDNQNEILIFSCAMHEEMQEIDDMWHTFILFTKDYSDFCNHYFGEFIHHVPIDEDNKLSKEKFEIDLTRYLSFIYDNLGEATLRKWFNEGQP